MNGGGERIAIDAERLAVGYDGRAVVSDLDVRLEAGDLLALVGTNGSGKSTLLKTVIGLLEPIDGSLSVWGRAPGSTPRRVAYVSQFRRTGFVLPLRTVDVVAMGRYAERGLFGRFTDSDRRSIEDAMTRLGIAELAGRAVAELSGGQRQRVYLAQALAHEADLLVLDEPTSGLDAGAREIYERVIAAERDRGVAILVATHDIGEAARATEVLLLAGRVVARGTPDEVLTAEHLLDAFGIGLRAVGGSVLAGEEPHAHGDPVGGLDRWADRGPKRPPPP
jgi:ABC-type Mn2+/Zn2+ transport system ATPase subunit